jgi:SWI/SNF-related matrix-associated actin-dependent regulator 1 of chromatin subfamily A
VVAKGVLLADAMGLGKSIQSVGVINAVEDIKQVLVICPASLRLNWKKELEKWLVRNMSMWVVDGGKQEAWSQAEIIIMNFDVVAKHALRIARLDIDLLIVDEAHYLKSPKAKRTVAIVGEGKTKGIQAKRKLFLSGTPITNRPIDIFPVLRALQPDGIGKSGFAFGKRYCDGFREHVGRGKKVWNFSGASNLAELQKRLRETCMIRRQKEDVLKELPDKRHQIIEIAREGGRSEEDDAILEGMADFEAAVELAKAGTKEDYKLAVLKLKSFIEVSFNRMSERRHEDALAKVPHIIEHLKDALEAGPVVCFGHHVDVLEAIRDGIDDVVIGMIIGKTKNEDRQAQVERFQNGEIQLMLGNSAMEVGLTLTASSHVVHAELDWVPATMNQRSDRCHRIGQKNSVLIQYLVFEDSLDAKMARTLVAKQRVISASLDDVTSFVKEKTKPQDTTVTIQRESIKEVAASLTREQVESIHQGLRMLAAYCDGAQSLDGMGFNKVDARIGRSLAEQGSMSPKQAAIGFKICCKYRRQLDNVLLEAIKG